MLGVAGGDGDESYQGLFSNPDSYCGSVPAPTLGVDVPTHHLLLLSEFSLRFHPPGIKDNSCLGMRGGNTRV